MKCIFCSKNSSNSKSVEHIIPESLGNKKHILRKGIVCDECNQYFAKKIEKRVLEMPYFRDVRHRNFIESKKRRIPVSKGIIGGSVDLKKRKDLGTEVIVNSPDIFQKILNGEVKHMIIPVNDQPIEDNKLISRFIAKIAIESAAQTFSSKKGWNNFIINTPEFKELRYYARFGDKPDMWNYSQRRIYNETDRFLNPKVSDGPYEVLHEQNLVFLRDRELYFVLVLFGIEYVISITNPKIDGYKSWLIENNNKCPIIEENERDTIKGERYF